MLWSAIPECQYSTHALVSLTASPTADKLSWMSKRGARLSHSSGVSFQTKPILTIVSGHFAHDVYTAFIAPLLPLLIKKLSLSLTLSGSLAAAIQLPSILSPLIGYLADHVNLRYFVILAPAVTATLISMLGLASSYPTLLLLLLTCGISVAAFHAPAPAPGLRQLRPLRCGSSQRDHLPDQQRF